MAYPEYCNGVNRSVLWVNKTLNQYHVFFWQQNYKLIDYFKDLARLFLSFFINVIHVRLG